MSPTVIEIIVKLHNFFKSYEQVSAWLSIKNLNLGGLSPRQLIFEGREETVLKFINTSLEENNCVTPN